MDPLKTFRKYILVESKEPVSLTKINEMSELPTFSQTDKEILRFMADNTVFIDEGAEANEVSDYLLNQDYFINEGETQEGKDFLSRSGGLDSLEIVMNSVQHEYGDVDYIADYIAKGEWDKIANLYALFRGEEILLASEVLAPLIANDERLDAGDIQDLQQELELFIG